MILKWRLFLFPETTARNGNSKAQSGDIDGMASLFNSVSFRDFVMTGYKNKCAITGNVIRYGSFMNLEAAHI
ncbi:hypothetical protein ACTM9V_05085 [Oliverpabstia intestinalis]|uniref:hypothetical protein n=1 Tax=Oliverpabstia intestinalis TaxID=2606633 RepID=UPI003F8A6D09